MMLPPKKEEEAPITDPILAEMKKQTELLSTIKSGVTFFVVITLLYMVIAFFGAFAR